MSNIRTSLPFPTQPWERAKEKFLEGLSDEEQKCFKNATLENLFYDASATQKRYVRGSKSWAMMEKITSLADSIEDYGKALDVYANAYPLILSPIWGSVRVVLHIASEAGKFQEKLVDMFARIGDALPQFRIYQTLFRKHERLLSALSAAYLDILSFCIRAKEFFSGSKKSLLPLSVVLKAAWKPFRTEFDAYIMGFRRHQKKIEKEAGLAHLIESARMREIELANRALQERNAKIDRRWKIIDGLPAVDYQTKHHRLNDLRHPGTGAWLIEHPVFETWFNSDLSDALCCYGIPGSGKSVLAASLTAHLASACNDLNSIVIHYHFDYADKTSLEPSRFIGSLLRQILVPLPLETFDEDFCNFFDDISMKSSRPSHFQILVQVLERFTKVYAIIDGIDECTHDGHSSVLNMISHLLESKATVFKMFVTSRTEEQAVRKLLKGHCSIDLSATQLHDDIASFIQSTMGSPAFSSKPVFKSRMLKQKITDALLEGANGMFLWARFQLYEILEAVTEDAVYKVLRNLPRDLNETYARIVKRIYSGRGGEEKIELMQILLRWVSCARRPLYLAELEEAIALQRSDTYLHTDRAATGAGEDLLSACGNLIVFNRDDQTVTLAHHTVQQFLQVSNVPRSSDYPSDVHFDLVAADIHVGGLCLAYLSFSDFETQIVELSPPVLVQGQEVEHIIWDQVPFSSYLRSAALKYFRWQRGSTKARASQALFAFPVSAPPPNLTSKYVMLEYIIEFWAFHTSSLSPNDWSWDVFRHIALHRSLPFEFRPWNSDGRLEIKFQNRHVPHTLMYSWAMDHGAKSLIHLLWLDEATRNDIWFELEQRKKVLMYIIDYDVRKRFTKSFYSGEFIYRAANWEAPQQLWRPEFDHSNIVLLLQSLLKEMSEHSMGDATLRTDELLRQALLLSVRNADARAMARLFDVSIGLYSKNSDSPLTIVIDQFLPILMDQYLFPGRVRVPTNYKFEIFVATVQSMDQYILLSLDLLQQKVICYEDSWDAPQFEGLIGTAFEIANALKLEPGRKERDKLLAQLVDPRVIPTQRIQKLQSSGTSLLRYALECQLKTTLVQLVFHYDKCGFFAQAENKDMSLEVLRAVSSIGTTRAKIFLHVEWSPSTLHAILADPTLLDLAALTR